MPKLSFIGLLSLLLLAATSTNAAPVGTGFSYQGELKVSSAPANGPFDFEFVLFNVVAGGSSIATVLQDDVAVSGGLFTVELDFTEVPFAAAETYFLEVRVRDGASVGGYTPLLPRQKITPTPYAINARSVQDGGVTQNAIAIGAIGSAQLASSAVTNDKINDDSVTDTKLADASVTDSKIADATITAGKLAFTPGDVTEVAAGTGLTGGGDSGDLTLAVDTSAIQARITETCPIGEYLRSIAADGTVTCESILSYLGITLTTTLDDQANSVGSYTSTAIGSDGLPVISYRDLSAGTLKVAKCVNAACTGAATITTVDDPANSVGRYTSIAIGSDGLPVISYQDVTASALKVAKCVNDACTGASIITTIDDPANLVGFHTSIAIGSDGLPVISYYDISAAALKVAKCANADCTGAATITTVDDPANSVGEYTAIAIGNDELPVISYYDASAFALKVAKCANDACTGAATITTVDDPANSVGQYTSIAIGSDGLPVISYYDISAGALKVAKCNNDACTGFTGIGWVDDPANDVGRYTSIAIGSDGLPVISYQDVTASALKVAKCVLASCFGGPTITTVDSPGEYMSIAIGSDGLPVISYRDNSVGALKVAKCGNPSCR